MFYNYSLKWVRKVLIIIVLIILLNMFGCFTHVPVNTDVTSLLPKETAMQYLNSISGCRFMENGLDLSKDKIVPFKDLSLTIQVGIVGEYFIYVGKKGIGSWMRSWSCFIVSGGHPSQKELDKIVTAIRSLGIDY